MTPEIEYVEEDVNPYGFDWGPMSVNRIAHFEGRGRVVEIRTEHEVLQVRVSENGRKIVPAPVRKARR